MGKVAEHIGHGHMRVPEGWFYKDICWERDAVDDSRKVAAVIADPFHDQIDYPVDGPSDQGEIECSPQPLTLENIAKVQLVCAVRSVEATAPWESNGLPSN
jgi:hypothetical protein